MHKTFYIKQYYYSFVYRIIILVIIFISLPIILYMTHSTQMNSTIFSAGSIKIWFLLFTVAIFIETARHRIIILNIDDKVLTVRSGSFLGGTSIEQEFPLGEITNVYAVTLTKENCEPPCYQEGNEENKVWGEVELILLSNRKLVSGIAIKTKISKIFVHLRNSEKIAEQISAILD